MLLQKIENDLRRHHLPLPPAPLIVALSGGGDSVALLLLLQQLGFSLVAAHCNFHLRGEESERDEQFVRHLCQKRQIPLEVQQFDTTTFARQEGISIEMAARQLRYDWFEKMRQAHGAAAIAVAHHSDDNAETLLLNLVRGSGLHGLRGMLPRNGHIIRPLLGVTRQELVNYLQEQQQDFVTDSTNEITIYKRNKIRHEVLPLLRELNPAIQETLAATTQHLAQAETLYQYAVNQLTEQTTVQLKDGWRVDLEKLAAAPAAATLLHELLFPLGFSPAEIAQIESQWSRPTGKYFESPTHLAVFHRGFLEVRTRPVKQLPQPLAFDVAFPVADGQAIFVRQFPRQDQWEIPKNPQRVALDADAVHGQLMLRSWEEGDRFTPFGMKGSKLVSDYLTDRHRSLIDKGKTLVVCDDRGIVWLVGERVAQSVAVTPKTTNVIEMSLQERKGDKELSPS